MKVVSHAVTAAAQRDRLVLDSATTDVVLKIKRFPLLFSLCAPVTRKSAPVIFHREFSLETRMNAAFVDDSVVIFNPILQFCPVFCPVISPPGKLASGDEFGSDCVLSQPVPSLWGMSDSQK